MSPGAEELSDQVPVLCWGVQPAVGHCQGWAGAALGSQVCVVLGQLLFAADSSTPVPLTPRSSGL